MIQLFKVKSYSIGIGFYPKSEFYKWSIMIEFYNRKIIIKKV